MSQRKNVDELIGEARSVSVEKSGQQGTDDGAEIEESIDIDSNVMLIDQGNLFYQSGDDIMAIPINRDGAISTRESYPVDLNAIEDKMYRKLKELFRL